MKVPRIKRTPEQRLARDEKKKLQRKTNEEELLVKDKEIKDKPLLNLFNSDSKYEESKVEVAVQRLRIKPNNCNEMVIGINKVQYAHETQTSSAAPVFSFETSAATKLTRGKFVDREKLAIKQAAELYMTQHDIPESHFAFIVDKNQHGTPYTQKECREFRKFVHEHSRLNRTSVQVGHYLMRIKDEHLGKWSQEEDTMLMDLKTQFGKQWSLISRKLGRPGCRVILKDYIIIQGEVQDFVKEGKWLHEWKMDFRGRYFID